MNRTIKKNIWVNQREADELREKAEAACLSEAEFIRKLIAGYVPPPRTDKEFYKAMEVLSGLSSQIHAAAMRMDSAKEMIALMAEAYKWNQLRVALEKKYLVPEEVKQDGGDKNMEHQG